MEMLGDWADGGGGCGAPGLCLTVKWRTPATLTSCIQPIITAANPSERNQSMSTLTVKEQTNHLNSNEFSGDEGAQYDTHKVASYYRCRNCG